MPGIQPSFSYSPPSLEELLKFPPEAIRKVATNIARRHWVLTASATEEIKECHSLHDHEFGVSVASIKSSTISGRLKRLSSQQFWLSNLGRILDSAREQKARCDGVLGAQEKGKMPYCSDATIEILKAREEEIAKRVAKSPRKNLAEIYKNSAKSTFNQAYLQAKAMDIVAKKRGMSWVFVTLTCPPEYHSSSQSFDGSSFDDGQSYLKRVFAQIGRSIGNAGYKSGKDFQGIRVVEVHKDGTPHWHVLYYFTGDLNKVIEQKLSNIYAQESSRPLNYLKDHKDSIFLYPEQNAADTQGGATTPAISYIFKKLTYAFQLYAHSENEDAIRHRYAIKAARARQIQPFGVTGHSTKIKVLRKAFDKASLPESLMELAAPLKTAVTNPARKNAQLQAMVGVLEGSLDSLKLLSVDTLNKFGEIVPRITYIQSMVSLEITCIEEPSNGWPEQPKKWGRGVSINDSSFSCGCVKCDQMLAAKRGIANPPAQSVLPVEIEHQPQAQGLIDSKAPGLPQAQDGGFHAAWSPARHDLCTEGPLRALQASVAMLLAPFCSLLQSGHIRLRVLLTMYLSLLLILLAAGNPTRNHQGHYVAGWSQSHHLQGMHPECQNYPKSKISHSPLTHGGRDPP